MFRLLMSRKGRMAREPPNAAPSASHQEVEDNGSPAEIEAAFQNILGLAPMTH